MPYALLSAALWRGRTLLMLMPAAAVVAVLRLSATAPVVAVTVIAAAPVVAVVVAVAAVFVAVPAVLVVAALDVLARPPPRNWTSNA